jgi:hypothetical protein
VADHAAVLVGMRAQGHVLVLAGDQIEDLDTVPAGPQLVVAEHPHPHVGADAAVVAQGQPGLVGECRVGPDPEAEDDRVGVAADAELLHRLVHRLAHARPSVLMGWGAWSTTVTATCRRSRASAMSTPM